MPASKNTKPKTTRSKTPKPRAAKPKAGGKKRPASGKSLFGYGFWLKLALVLGVVAVVVLAYLDALVTDKFEGRRWALPAKVYARPLELFAGQSLRADNLAHELKLLGYRESSEVNRPGQYQRQWNRFSLFTRDFKLWNEQLVGQRVELRISGDKVASITDAAGAPIDLMTLEPYHIGGIYPTHHEDRSLIRIEEVPGFVVQTLVAVEDQGFHSHHGVSPKAISRAMWANLKSGRVVQGGSTLTQQLVKNFYLSSEQTLSRKAEEALMAILLDFHYSKDEILEAYLNEIYLGQAGSRAIHGFGLGSQYYFGRSVRELKLHQAALLVAIVKGPSYYNPRRHPQRAMARRDLVLDILAAEGVATADQVEWAKRQPLDVIAKPSWSPAAYPAYMDLVKRQLHRDYNAEDLTSEGLHVYTSLDPMVQRDAEQSLEQGMAQLGRNFGAQVASAEGAIVVTSTDTAEVLALVGGKDTKYSGFNRALDAVRPVGSLLKPAVYLSALVMPERYTLATLVDDEPVTITSEGGKDWTPRNFDHKSHGMVPLRHALAQSYNQATARLGMAVGLDRVLKTISDLGVTRELPAYPSIMLGASGLAPIEVAGMYQTIAAGGFDAPLRSIRAVTNAHGEPLRRYPLNIEQRFSPEQIHLIYYALQETMREGTGKSAYKILPADLNIAGKTGSTDDLRDSWFAGFTGDRLSVVWLGNDDNSPIGLTGGRGGLQIWVELMRRLQPQPFTGVIPANIEYMWIDEATGLASSKRCMGARYMPFIKGSGPTRKASCTSRASELGEWIRSWFD